MKAKLQFSVNFFFQGDFLKFRYLFFMVGGSRLFEKKTEAVPWQQSALAYPSWQRF